MVVYPPTGSMALKGRWAYTPEGHGRLYLYLYFYLDGWPSTSVSRYVTGHPRQLSLAIPFSVGAMSTIESWDVNTKQAYCMMH